MTFNLEVGDTVWFLTSNNASPDEDNGFTPVSGRIINFGSERVCLLHDDTNVLFVSFKDIFLKKELAVFEANRLNK